MRTNYADNTRQKFRLSTPNIPPMLSDADHHLLFNITPYLTQVGKIVSMKIENGYSADQLFLDLNPLVFEGTVYSVESAQKKTLEILDSIKHYPHFYTNEILLFDLMWDYCFDEISDETSKGEYENFRTNSLQHFTIYACLLANATIYFSRSEYDKLASVLERLVVYNESKGFTVHYTCIASQALSTL
jgi:hypothetical protein